MPVNYCFPTPGRPKLTPPLARAGGHASAASPSTCPGGAESGVRPMQEALKPLRRLERLVPPPPGPAVGQDEAQPGGNPSTLAGRRARPAATTLWNWLGRAVADGQLRQSGQGTAHHPFRYWLPELEQLWEKDLFQKFLQDREDNPTQWLDDLRASRKQRDAAIEKVPEDGSGRVERNLAGTPQAATLASVQHGTLSCENARWRRLVRSGGKFSTCRECRRLPGASAGCKPAP